METFLGQEPLLQDQEMDFWLPFWQKLEARFEVLEFQVPNQLKGLKVRMQFPILQSLPIL